MQKLVLEQELDLLFGKKNQRIKPGIESVVDAFPFVPEFENMAPSALVGGTNGKGTTSGMLWHLLAGAGVKTGLYTSPHIIHFSERIQTSHFLVDDAYLLDEAKVLQKLIPLELYERLSFFDLSTILAARIFTKLDCEWNVFEVGLGGRWDSTNALSHELMAIVSIGFDHEAWLGNTLGKIADEKLGIVKSGKPLFWGLHVWKDREASEALSNKKSAVDFPVFKVQEEIILNEITNTIQLQISGLSRCEKSLPKWFQTAPSIVRQNFQLSLAMFYWIVHHEKFENVLNRLQMTPLQVFELGLKNFASPQIPWPPTLVGRFQTIDVQATKIVLDVCHNVDSVQQFVLSMKKNYQTKVPGIISILQDKDVAGMLQQLGDVLEPIIIFKSGGERAISQQRLNEAGVQNVLFEDFDDAWQYVQKHWDFSTHKTVAICGSFYGVGAAVKYFQDKF